MISRVYQLFFFLFFALPLFAGATVLPRGGGGINNSCNTGTLQCCNSVQSSTNSGIAGLVGLASLVLGPITGQVGVSCTPITVIGAGGNSCSAQPACCTGNSWNGVINVGCSPINLNL
ncbi:hydrophobin-319 [Panaeolus papilionaceus]|nr:hydrophobin-319 [Panaeolus papilionaceus]